MSLPTLVTEDKGRYSEINQLETKIENDFISQDDDDEEVSSWTETVPEKVNTD